MIVVIRDVIVRLGELAATHGESNANSVAVLLLMIGLLGPKLLILSRFS
jgi:hypothetical protein